MCIHPGWPILRDLAGRRGVVAAHLRGPGRNQFIVTNDVVSVVGDVAWITLDENLVQGGMTATIAATNVFVRSGGGWRMVLHHGSPVMTR